MDFLGGHYSAYHRLKQWERHMLLVGVYIGITILENNWIFPNRVEHIHFL